MKVRPFEDCCKDCGKPWWLETILRAWIRCAVLIVEVDLERQSAFAECCSFARHLATWRPK